MRYGVHVSIGQGFVRAALKAETIGCESFQIFAGNPRGWARKDLLPADAEQFRQAVGEKGLGPVVVHLSYLPNPAAADPDLYERSILAIGEDFRRANLLGAGYFVLHPGSCPEEERGNGLQRAIRGLKTVLEQVKGTTMLLLENQSSRPREIGADLGELADLARALGEERVGICLDTCHAFVAGYDLRSEDGWRGALDLLAERLELARLRVLHLNDAKGALGSGLDRHEHIGQGFLGSEAFAAMGRLGILADRTAILETPQDGPEDDPRNLARIRALVEAR